MRLVAEYRSLHFSGIALSYPLSEAETTALVGAAQRLSPKSEARLLFASKGILSYLELEYAIWATSMYAVQMFNASVSMCFPDNKRTMNAPPGWLDVD